MAVAQICSSSGATLRSGARSLARVRHPAVVRLFEVLDGPDGPILVMEPVPGETLGARQCVLLGCGANALDRLYIAVVGGLCAGGQDQRE